MHVAWLTPTGLACQACDERAVAALHQLLQHRLALLDIHEPGHAARSRAQLARGLRSAQHELAHHRQFLRSELERPVFGVAEAMLVLWHPRTEARLLDDEVSAGKSIEDRLHARLIEIEDWI